MLNNKDYCDYDTCVALMDLGYDDSTDLRYNSYGSLGDFLGGIKAPSLYEAQKFLREEWGVHITINYMYHLKEHVFGVTLRFMGKALRDSGVLYDTTKYSSYEEALLEGIKEAVKLLKEKK